MEGKTLQTMLQALFLMSWCALVVIRMLAAWTRMSIHASVASSWTGVGSRGALEVGQAVGSRLG
jgi:hypothetical protein